MSQTTYLEELRRLVRAQTTKIGVPVANIHGGATGTVGGSSGQSSAGSAIWSVASSSSTSLASVEAFHQDQLASPSSSATTAAATAGALVVAGQDANNVLVSGSLSLTQPRSFPLAVDTGQVDAAFTVAVNGRVVQQGTGSTVTTVSLAPGIHSIEVLSSSPTVGVRTPSDLNITPGFDAVKTPVWESVETGYQDTGSGAAANVLTWYADIRAGQWRVLRRTFTTLSQITGFGPIDSNGIFTVVLDGQQNVDVGTDVFAGAETMGRAVSSTYDADDDVTNVSLRLSPGTFTTNAQWAGRTAQQGSLDQVALVTRTGSTLATWSDPNVETGARYEYALQAQGLGTTAPWSPVSDVRSIQSGDRDPPASIVFDTDYPRVVQGLGRMRFSSPSDADYAGVKIYYRRFYTGSSTAATSTTLTGGGGAFPISVVDWRIRITSGTGQFQERAISVSTSTQVTVTEPWTTIPPNGSNYIVYYDSPIKTEYGIPLRLEDGTFELASTLVTAPTQLYHFRSFDKAGNEQSDQDCATWTFDPTTDLLSIGTIDLIMDGGDPGIGTGMKWDFEVDFACQIIAAHLYCTTPATGSIVLDIQKVAYAAFPPSGANSIVASAPPTLTAAAKSSDITLTGWTTTIAKGDILRVVVTSALAITVTLSLTIHRS